MFLFLKAIPLKYWAAAAAAIALVVYYNVHVHNLEVHYAAEKVAAVNAAVTAASDKLQAAAEEREAKMAADYAASLKQVNDEHTKAMADEQSAHAADLQRLRQLSAALSNGRGDGALDGPAGADSPSDSGGSSLVGLGYVSAELAAALHDARDDLRACYDERASLNGK